MFYYLLYNSSLLKNKKSKDRIVFTLIGGSLIYLVLHAFISNSLKTEFIKYIWFLFIIDLSAIFVSSDFQGFSSVQITNLTNNSTQSNPNLDSLTKKNTVINSKTVELDDNDIEEENIKLEIDTHKKNTPSKNKTSKSKKNLKTKSQRDKSSKLSSRKKEKKKVSFEDSTPINFLNTEGKESQETYNLEEANNINLTLESLESLNLSNLDISEDSGLPLAPRKKMEDEYSDIGSELDLTKFENAIANSN
jgi:hypothetical protein